MPRKSRSAATARPATTEMPRVQRRSVAAASISTESGWLEYLKSNYLILMVVIAASFLRFWNLPAQAILSGESARSMLTALEALEAGQVPLTGAVSSIAGVYHGPLTTWFQMILLLATGQNVEGLFWGFAILSVMGVIAMYEFVTLAVNKQAGLVAALLLAFSPVAVVHGRMAAEVGVLPLLLLLFLASLLQLAQGKPRSLIWSVILGCLLLQLELGALPLLTLIPLVWRWSTAHQPRVTLSKVTLSVGGGVIIGLLPLLIFELTTGFSQSRSWLIWAGTLLRTFSPVTVLPETVLNFGTDGARIWSADVLVLTIIGWVALIASAWLLIGRWRRHQATLLEKIVLSGLGLSLLPILIIGSPTQGFYAIATVWVVLIFTLAWTHLLSGWQKAAGVGLMVWAVFTLLLINHCNYFTGPACSFSYGSSLSEQRRIVSFLKERHIPSVWFYSTSEADSSLLDNWHLVSRELGIEVQAQTGQPVYLEPKDSPLKSYPGMTRFSFTSHDVYVVH